MACIPKQDDDSGIKAETYSYCKEKEFLYQQSCVSLAKKYCWFHPRLPSALFSNLKNKDEMSGFLCDGRQETWKQKYDTKAEGLEFMLLECFFQKKWWSSELLACTKCGVTTSVRTRL
jgi:hypothetical protein